MKIFKIFTLTVDVKNSLCEFEYIHQKILPPNFHENPALLETLIQFWGQGASRIKS